MRVNPDIIRPDADLRPQKGLIAAMPTVPTKSGAALLLESRIGEQFDALVTGASDKGTWVRLLKIPVASPKPIVLLIKREAPDRERPRKGRRTT